MAISNANKKIELYYWIGDNSNYDPDDSGTTSRWLRANTSEGKNAVLSVDYEHALGKPATAKVTLQNGVPNFKAGDADSYSSVFASLPAADDGGSASPVFTDFMRVKLVDINTKLVILYGRIYDIKNEYNNFEGNTCKLVIKDELEVLRGIYSSELPDQSYTGGSTKRSTMIKTNILANSAWNTPAADNLQIATDDTDRFEDSISEYGTTGVLKLKKSGNNILNEIAIIARADPNDITSGDDRRAKSFGYDYYLDANQTQMDVSSINSVIYDVTAPASAHLNYFKRGSRTATPATYGLTVELPNAAFTPTGQKLPMLQDFSFDRPKHEVYTEAQVTGIFKGNIKSTKTFESIIVSGMSSGHEFDYEGKPFSTGFEGGTPSATADSLTSEYLDEYTADGSSKVHDDICKVQWQSDTGTGTKYLLISDLTSDFPEGTTQVMLKGASSGRSCLFTPSTGRLRNKTGVKRTFKTQWGLDGEPASAAGSGATYDRARERLATILSRAGGTGNEIIRGSFSIPQYPSYYKDVTPTSTSSTVCNTSVNLETYGVKKGMPIGILDSNSNFMEYHSYASATASGAITVGDAPTKSDPTATHGWTASTAQFSGAITARAQVPVRAGDLIKVINKIENINTDMLVTKVSYMEGPGVQNARIEVVGEQAALAGRVPKTTSNNMPEEFGASGEVNLTGNYSTTFSKDGDNSVIEFTAATRNTVTWTAGLLNLEDGQPLETNVNSFAIGSGTTGTMSEFNTSSASTRADTTYVVYLDLDVSKTALQVTTQTLYAQVDDSNTTIIALCKATESDSGAASLGLSEFVATNTSSTPLALGRSNVITGSQFQTAIATDGTNSATASSSEGRIVILDDKIIIHDGASTTKHLQWYKAGTEIAFIGHSVDSGTPKFEGMYVINYDNTSSPESRNLTLWSQNGKTVLRGGLGVDVVTGNLNIQHAASSGDVPNLSFSNQATGTLRWRIGVDGDDSDKMKWDWQDLVGDATKMTLDSSGNLYVGPSGSFAGFYSWLNDQNTYMDNPAADQLRIVTGGTQNTLFEDGNIYVGPGGGFSGVYTWLNDTNTYIDNPQADTIRLMTGGTQNTHFEAGNIYVGAGGDFGGAYTWIYDPNTYISNPSADRIALYTGGTLNATFEANNIYIGPSGDFGGAYTWFYDPDTSIQNPSADLMRINVGGDTLAEFRESGGSYFTGINQAYNGSYNFIVAGSVAKTTAGTVWTSTSDDRLKQDIASITNATDVLKTLNPVEYNWKDEWKDAEASIPNHKVHGFLASEYEDTFSDFVDTTDMKLIKRTDDSYRQSNEVEEDETIIYDNIKFINTDSLVPHLVAAIKELDARIASLEGG